MSFKTCDSIGLNWKKRGIYKYNIGWNSSIALIWNVHCWKKLFHMEDNNLAIQFNHRLVQNSTLKTYQLSTVFTSTHRFFCNGYHFSPFFTHCLVEFSLSSIKTIRSLSIPEQVKCEKFTWNTFKRLKEVHLFRGTSELQAINAKC